MRKKWVNKWGSLIFRNLTIYNSGFEADTTLEQRLLSIISNQNPSRIIIFFYNIKIFKDKKLETNFNKSIKLICILYQFTT